MLKESAFIDGDLVFILYNIDPETLENLHHVVEDFKQKLTCVAISCAYLQDAQVDGFSKIHYRPTQWLKSLLKRASQGKGIDLELLSPKYKNPIDFLNDQKKDEDLGEIVNTAVQILWQKLKQRL